MAQSYVTFTGDGSSTGPITLGFNYILKSHVKVYESRDILLGTGTLKTETTHYTFNTAGTQISMVAAPANGVVITVERETPNDDQIVAYADGSNLIADSLNNADKQTLFCTQELEDRQALAATKALAAKSEAETATSNVATLTANPIFSGNFGSTAISVNDSTNINLGSSGSTDSSISYNGAGSGALDINTAGQFSVTSTGSQNFKIGSTLRLALIDSNVDSADGIYCNWPVIPGANDTYDLGTDAFEWRDLWIDGTAHIDTLDVDENATITGTITAGGLAGGALVDSSEHSAVTANDTTVFSTAASDARYFIQTASTDEVIESNWLVWPTDGTKDNYVATPGAIDKRIQQIVDDVGGFVVAVNEGSFPSSHPDPKNDAGTIVNVTALSAERTASAGSGSANTGVLTTGFTTTGSPGQAVTINGCPNSQVFAVGYGILVQTTTTEHTYDFVRYLADTSSVAAISTKATEIGRLGTAAAVEDLGILGTADVVADMAILGTTDVVSDMNTLANTDVLADLERVANVSGSVEAIGSDLANNYANITDYGDITGAVSATSGTSDITTVADSIDNVNAVAGQITPTNKIATVAGDTTAINNITSNLSAVQNAATNATNAASSATAAASSATGAATSATTATTQATTATTQATTATTQATTATTQATNAAASANSAASSASTSTAQAAISTTQATNAAASASTANTHQQTAKQWRDDASGIKTQAESNVYNLSDSVSSHTAWGNITDVGTTHFLSESGNVLLTMTKGSSVYDYGAVA